MTTLDRYLGCMLGLAAGDALGTTLEFEQPGTFSPLTDMIGGGPFDLRPGEWTDDTSMALCLAESLVTQGEFDPIHQLETYCRWYGEGHLSVKGRCFDIGGTTRQALNEFQRNRCPYPGATGERSAGNGSLMRLAPAPLRFANGRNWRSISLARVRARPTAPSSAWTPAAISRAFSRPRSAACPRTSS